jgi:hypothetical protein
MLTSFSQDGHGSSHFSLSEFGPGKASRVSEGEIGRIVCLTPLKSKARGLARHVERMRSGCVSRAKCTMTDCNRERRYSSDDVHV